MSFSSRFDFLSFHTWGNSGLGAILRLWESALQDSTRPTSGPCNDGERQWSTMSDRSTPPESFPVPISNPREPKHRPQIRCRLDTWSEQQLHRPAFYSSKRTSRK